MATIPWHEAWMRDTYSRFDARSDKFKAVDLAIFVYDSNKSEECRLAIKTALDSYIFEHKRRGKDWTQSVRNQRGAVTNLYRAVNDLDARALTQDDLDAIEAAVELQQAALKTMFQGKSLSLRSLNKKRHAEGVAKLIKGVQGSAANIRDLSLAKSSKQAAAAVNVVAGTGITDKFKELVKTVSGALDPEMVMRELGLGSVNDFAKSMAPALGIIASASDTAVGVCKIAYQSWSASSLRAASTWTLAPGDPLAAFHALETLLDREINSTIATTAIAGAAFTAKMLCGALDLGAASGPAIGLAETIAKAIQKITEFVRDALEVEKGNALLARGDFGIGLFQTCPILGCYFLVVQDHSTIINMAVADYGTANWKMDVERMMSAARPVLAKSAEFVRASPWEIAGMENQKGIKQVGWDKMTTTEKAVNLKQHVIDGLVDAVSSDKTAPTATVDRSRIVGFGSENPPPPRLERSGGRIVPPPLPPRPIRARPSIKAPTPVTPSPSTPTGPMSMGDFVNANRGALPARID